MDQKTSIIESPPVTSVSTSGSQDSWKYRRRFLLANTVFDMAVILVSLLFAKMESVAQIGIIMAFGSLTAIFGFYVAGVVWDDHSIRTTQMQGLAITKVGGSMQPQTTDDKGP